MNKKLSAILCLVLGIGVFIAAVSAATPNPILRSTEDSAIRAEYTAPIINARVESNGSVRHTSGQAHAQRPSKASTDDASASDTAQDSAHDTAETSVVEGQFSTATAREYRSINFHARAPNVQYVQQSCPLCGTKH